MKLTNTSFLPFPSLEQFIATSTILSEPNPKDINCRMLKQSIRAKTNSLNCVGENHFVE